MAYFASDLPPPSLVMLEVKIHYVVYDDSGSKTANKWYWCLSHSVDWRLEKIIGRRGWCIWWESPTHLQVALIKAVPESNKHENAITRKWS